MCNQLVLINIVITLHGNKMKTTYTRLHYLFQKNFLGLLCRPLVLGCKIFSEMKEHMVVLWTKRRDFQMGENKNAAYICVCYSIEICESSLANRINVQVMCCIFLPQNRSRVNDTLCQQQLNLVTNCSVHKCSLQKCHFLPLCHYSKPFV